eukprot:m.40043 g.40043  ORF g.40043 m.40043 type:complete len:445 (-) comp11684_c0_seq1:439-1773(-)
MNCVALVVLAVALAAVHSTYAIDATCTIVNDYGCFLDTVQPRTFPQRADNAKSLEECASNCYFIGFTGTAGMENGDECYCSNKQGPIGTSKPSSDCDKPCPDDSSQTCGGLSRVSEFSFQCSAPQQKYYSCAGGLCVEDPQGPWSKPNCNDACTAPPTPPSPAPPTTTRTTTTTLPWTTTAEVQSSSQHWQSHCTNLGLPFSQADGAPSFPSSRSVLLDVKTNQKRTMFHLTWEGTHCEGQPIFEARFEMESNSDPSSRSEQLQLQTSIIRFNGNMSALVTSLNKYCPCGGTWRTSTWRSVEPHACAELPAVDAPWLCWILGGNDVTINTVFSTNAYTRTLLNTSVAYSNAPADSPYMFHLPLESYPDGHQCTYQLWSSCGTYISNTITHCSSLYSSAHAEFRDACMLSALYNPTADFDIGVCCPCMEKYAASYAPWAQLPCGN